MPACLFQQFTLSQILSPSGAVASIGSAEEYQANGHPNKPWCFCAALMHAARLSYFMFLLLLWHSWRVYFSTIFAPIYMETCHFSAEMLTKSKRISFCQVSGLVGTDTLQRDDIYRFPHLRCSMQAVMLTDNEMVFALRYLMPSTPTVIHVLATCLSSVRPHMVLNFGQYIQSAHATFDPFIAEVCHPGNQTPGCVRSTALAPANTQ